MISTVRDIVNSRRNRKLAERGDVFFELLRRNALVLPHQRDHRNFDRRKNIRRRLLIRQAAENQNEQRHHNKGVRATECEFNYPHGEVSFLKRGVLLTWANYNTIRFGM